MFFYTIHPLSPPPLGKDGEENIEVTSTPLKLRGQVGWNLSSLDPLLQERRGKIV